LVRIAEGSKENSNATTVWERANRDFTNYQYMEKVFQQGFEHELVKGILTAWEKHSLAHFDQVQSRYESGRGRQLDIARAKNDRFAGCIAVLLEICRENLFEFLKPFL
jgi:hypothetical protein